MGAKWMWSEAHQSAFETVKRALNRNWRWRTTTRVYPPCSRSARVRPGGAVLAQQQEDGSESDSVRFWRSPPCERVYSQIQKRSDRDYFGVKSSTNICMVGRSICSQTDQPLYQYLGTKGIPEMTANSCKDMHFLSAYNYTVQYVRSANNVADYLSSLALAGARGCGSGADSTSADVEDGKLTLYLHFISSNDQSSITIKEIKVETQNDPMLHSVVNFIRNGWPRKCPFFKKTIL
ncbi:hypothetical protein EVAR_91958_1 [Eumeta japonica]|uniref:Uncharacterized protein n=1 Tax=Eumeta variegata TaxID=151549 RepID=A0A4C1TCV1_EUMVA|nr:hypothetical protein EVAR_91958_1 [Eumeta japonica]